ncbi:MAG: alkaline phosphatase D family protein [Mariniphaga sp.]
MKAFPFFLILFSILTTISCTTETRVSESFNNINDRHWVGKNYWSIPLEDWKVKNGELHCIGTVPNSRVNLLTHVLAPGSGGFVVTSKIGLTNEGTIPGSAGLWIGVHDKEDPDVRAACYFGKGIQAGISLQGFAFLRDQRVELPAGFDFHDVTLTITGNDKGLKMKVVDKSGKSPDELTCDADGIQGIIAMVNNFNLGRNQKPGNSTFCFDDFKLSGSKVVHQPDNSFGPILWTMYTLNEGTVKLMVLLPPVGNDDNQAVHLQLKKDNTWETVATEEIDPDSRTAVFRLSDWDHSSTVDYRVEYIETGKNGTRMPEYFEGTIRQEPVDRPLTLGGLTCQFHYGFPYTPLVKNLNALNPDMLYFSGDQIYEANGGYPVKREPADVSIINYLGKYYMFGWAFRDLMRDRPTICTPDDHDVFHGNLWGDGGTSKPEGVVNDDTQGFSQSVKMVNVVNQTNCGQLPDPYDPTPIKQGMSVWYTSLTYGRVSFAIISDRIFKTGPEVVSDWGGRKDHMKEPREDLSFLDQSGVEMIGDRQMHFLHEWIRDWEDADMKVLLSQTVFANIATHHGNREGYLYGDLDSGGWPKSGRDKIIKLMRKAAVFHINGDQHVPSLSQYGLQNTVMPAGASVLLPLL